MRVHQRFGRLSHVLIFYVHELTQGAVVTCSTLAMFLDLPFLHLPSLRHLRANNLVAIQYTQRIECLLHLPESTSASIRDHPNGK